MCKRIVDLCDEYTKRANGRNTRYDGAIATAKLCAVKEGITITKAQGHWGKLKGFFGPATDRERVGNPTLLPVNRPDARVAKTQNGITASADSNYWLEFADPKHRSFSNLDDGMKLFDTWFESNTTDNFWDWLERNGPTIVGSQMQYDLLQRVSYVDPEQRWKYQVYLVGDNLRYRGERDAVEGGPMPPLPPLLDTSAMTTAHSGDGFGIWVCSPNGAFYTYSHNVCVFHHSSFLGGGRVIGAGEWVVRGGKLLLITHKTGHYRAGPEHLSNCIRLLRDARVNLRETIVLIASFEGDTRKFLIRAEDFLRVNGKFDKAEPLQLSLDDLPGLHADLRGIITAKAWDNGTHAIVTTRTVTGSIRAAGTLLGRGLVSFQKPPDFVQDAEIAANGTYKINLSPDNYWVYVIPEATLQHPSRGPWYSPPDHVQVRSVPGNRIDVAYTEADRQARP
jgi:hypothetical protein